MAINQADAAEVFGVRVQIRAQPGGALLVDVISREWNFTSVVIDALRCMHVPCYHFSVDLMLPDGSPGFCERKPNEPQISKEVATNEPKQ